MGLIVTDDQHYTNIADAIRGRNGTSNTYMPSQMPSAIANIPAPSGYADVTGTTANASDVRYPETFVTASGIETTGSLKFDWMGENPEFIKDVYSLSTTLDQTGFNGWTPSTTALSIKATETLTTTESLNLENYEYLLVWISDCQVAYDSTWTASKGAPLRVVCLYTQGIFRRPNTVANVEAENFNYNVAQQDIVAEYWVKYYSSASAISLAYTTYSPCYISAVTAPTFSSTSSNTPTLTIKTPVLSTRCSTSYFTVANAEKVDQENTTVKMIGKFYRVKKGTIAARQGWKIITDIWNSPL